MASPPPFLPPGLLPPATTDPCAELLLNDTRLSRMAMEFARDLLPGLQILASYNISEEDFRDRVVNSAPFMRYYAEHKEIWDSATSTALRVTLKAGMQFEDWLAEANILMHDRNQPMGPKVELAKELARLAGFDNVHHDRSDGPTDSKSTIIINLGHGRERIVIEKEVTQPGDDAQVINASPLPSQVNQPSSHSANINHYPPSFGPPAVPPFQPSQLADPQQHASSFRRGSPYQGPGTEMGPNKVTNQ